MLSSNQILIRRLRNLAAAIGALSVGLFASAGEAGLITPTNLLAPQIQSQTQPQFEEPEADAPADMHGRFHRQTVPYNGAEAAGTVIIDTPNTYLYLVLGNGKAMRYGIGVGREGFTWSGTQTISRKAEWPDWNPPAEMIARQPYLPRFMAGGPGNPLGARAMYLGGTIYRIHGTNNPASIGTRVSSGCIRLTNADVEDLYSRVGVGTKVIVLPMQRNADAATK